MQPGKKKYGEMVNKATPPSNKVLHFTNAFWIGGLICAIGQGFVEFYKFIDLSEENVKIAVPITMVFLGAFFTAIDVYRKIARYAGAGTLVPITGFSNSVASPAMEFKEEGQVLGVGAKMFSIAGPVIVFGVIASAIYGIVLCIMGKGA